MDSLVQTETRRQQIIDLATGQVRSAFLQPPASTSANGPWSGLLLEHHVSTPCQAQDVAPIGHCLVLSLTGSAAIEWQIGSEPVRVQRMSPGDCTVIPAMTPVSIQTKDTGEFLIIAIDPKALQKAGAQLIRRKKLQLQPALGVNDPVLSALALALKSELESGYLGGSCYGESITHSLCVHLVRHYSAISARQHAGQRGLPRPQVKKVVAYIAQHCQEQVSLKEMADLVGLSPFHFARLFKSSVGASPYQYLLQIRLERGKELLLSRRYSAGEIAVRVGFSDQSHFVRLFKRAYGLTPGAFLRATSSTKSAS